MNEIQMREMRKIADIQFKGGEYDLYDGEKLVMFSISKNMAEKFRKFYKNGRVVENTRR